MAHGLSRGALIRVSHASWLSVPCSCLLFLAIKVSIRCVLLFMLEGERFLRLGRFEGGFDWDACLSLQRDGPELW